MGSASSLETSVPAEDLQRGSPTQSAPFRRIAVCVDGSEMGETVVLHAANVAAAFGVPLAIPRVLGRPTASGARLSGAARLGVGRRSKTRGRSAIGGSCAFAAGGQPAGVLHALSLRCKRFRRRTAMTSATVETSEAPSYASIRDRVVDACRQAAHRSHEARLAKSLATDAVENGKRGVEELAELKGEAVHRVRRQPLGAVGIALGVGLVLGVAVGWIGRRPGRRE